MSDTVAAKLVQILVEAGVRRIYGTMTGAALAELSHVIYSHAETAGADRRCGVMEERQLNAFANARLDHSIKLAIARDLERLYSSAVTEPMPAQLHSSSDLGRR